MQVGRHIGKPAFYHPQGFALLLMLIATLMMATLSTPAQALQNDFLNLQKNEFLPVEEAFAFQFDQTENTLTLRWDIAPDYYLYQHRFTVSPESVLAAPLSFPEGLAHADEFFGDSTIYRDQVTLVIDLAAVAADTEVTIGYQGCADAGLCYPPEQLTLYLDETSGAATTTEPNRVREVAANSQATENTNANPSFAEQLAAQSLPIALLAFLLLGIGLAFTPCVLPMYPIISSIILGHQRAANGQLSALRALTLSSAYVLGMALTYTALGIIVALAGMQYQAALQHPAVLIVLAVVFVILGLSMFGIFNLQLPSGLQEKLQNLTNKQRGGAAFSVFLMGAISGLVVSPCTTAPLSGILLFVAQSGDVVVGASALFALSIGMGIPLIIVGVSGGKLLPKAGAWMNTVKQFFGVLLVGVALIMIERLLPIQVGQWLWVAFFILAGIYLLHCVLSHARGWRATAAATLIAIASASGVFWQLPNQSINHLEFTQVRDLTELDAQLKLAAAQGQPVMLDLYADWCVACKEFERYTFSDPKVQQALAGYRVLQADVTANTAANNALLERYQVFGLPTILFFDATATEYANGRVTGFLDAADFHTHLKQLETRE